MICLFGKKIKSWKNVPFNYYLRKFRWQKQKQKHLEALFEPKTWLAGTQWVHRSVVSLCLSVSLTQTEPMKKVPWGIDKGTKGSRKIDDVWGCKRSKENTKEMKRKRAFPLSVRRERLGARGGVPIYVLSRGSLTTGDGERERKKERERERKSL